MRACQRFTTGLSGREVGMAVEGQREGSLGGQEWSLSLLYKCQYPGCDTLQDVTTGIN